MLWTTLLVGVLCGIVGILVDIDHLISHFNGRSGHFLHTPILIIAGIIICGALAYLGGLLIRMVLI